MVSGRRSRQQLERCRVHIFPTNTLEITTIQAAVFTENKLDTGRKTHTTPGVRKIHGELGRKGREAIRLAPVPMDENTQEDLSFHCWPPLLGCPICDLS